VIEVGNAGGDRAFIASAQLQKRLRGGTELGLAYTYTDARDRLSAYHDLHEINLGDVPLDGPLDHRRVRTSTYGVPHKITAYAAADLPLGFRASLFYLGHSGQAFTYVVRGDANADGVGIFGGPLRDDPVYVPRSPDDITLAAPGEYPKLAGLVSRIPCLRTQRGHLLRRNSCRDPWANETSARISRIFSLVRGQSLELMADLFNVLNLLDDDWGVRRGIDNNRLLELVGYDHAHSRGIYRVLPVDQEAAEGTHWRFQLGARYVC
jgi:hypothetical protein